MLLVSLERFGEGEERVPLMRLQSQGMRMTVSYGEYFACYLSRYELVSF